jgi:hypothetical protein
MALSEFIRVALCEDSSKSDASGDLLFLRHLSHQIVLLRALRFGDDPYELPHAVELEAERLES